MKMSICYISIKTGKQMMNIQKYFALIAQAKQCMNAMCILGDEVVKLIAHDKLSNA